MTNKSNNNSKEKNSIIHSDNDIDNDDIDDNNINDNNIDDNNIADIDNVLNSESDNQFDIDADTETMNNQLNKQINKQINKKNKLDDSDSLPKKICQIDKNTLKTLIVEWLSLDDQIKSYNEVVKDLNIS